MLSGNYTKSGRGTNRKYSNRQSRDTRNKHGKINPTCGNAQVQYKVLSKPIKPVAHSAAASACGVTTVRGERRVEAGPSDGV